MSGIRSWQRARRATLVLSLLALAPVTAGAASASPPSPPQAPCTQPAPAGGRRPSYGRDLANSRNQAGETTIDGSNAAGLTPAWKFSTGAAPSGDAGINASPVVANGCVYTGATDGSIFALDATTGRLVWTAKQTATTPGTGGTIVGSAAVSGNEVVFLIDETADGNGSGPYAVAYNKSTGALLWRSRPISTHPGFYTNASPVIADGLVFAGVSPAEGDPTGQGGFGLIDARTGAIVKFTEVIPSADQAAGYAGAGVWSTPAVDTATGYAYVGTSNPYSKQQEHRYTNAIIKVDMSKSRPTFGQVVDAYKGNVDQYNEALLALRDTPACAETADQNVGVVNPVCGQIDLDFGAAPNLFTDAQGHQLVGGLQKAGVYHAAYADTMEAAWKSVVGGPCALCNAASTAVGPTGVAVEGTPGGQLFSLARQDGAANWVSPVGDGEHYQALAEANNVLYVADSAGLLDIVDASTGVPILRRPVAADIGEPDTAALTSAGASVAEHGVFLATTGTSGGWIVAYRLPASPSSPSPLG